MARSAAPYAPSCSGRPGVSCPCAVSASSRRAACHRHRTNSLLSGSCASAATLTAPGAQHLPTCSSTMGRRSPPGPLVPRPAAAMPAPTALPAGSGRAPDSSQHAPAGSHQMIEGASRFTSEYLDQLGQLKDMLTPESLEMLASGLDAQEMQQLQQLLDDIKLLDSDWQELGGNPDEAAEAQREPPGAPQLALVTAELEADLGQERLFTLAQQPQEAELQQLRPSGAAGHQAPRPPDFHAYLRQSVFVGVDEEGLGELLDVMGQDMMQRVERLYDEMVEFENGTVADHEMQLKYQELSCRMQALATEVLSGGVTSPSTARRARLRRRLSSARAVAGLVLAANDAGSQQAPEQAKAYVPCQGQQLAAVRHAPRLRRRQALASATRQAMVPASTADSVRTSAGDVSAGDVSSGASSALPATTPVRVWGSGWARPRRPPSATPMTSTMQPAASATSHATQQRQQQGPQEEPDEEQQSIWLLPHALSAEPIAACAASPAQPLLAQAQPSEEQLQEHADLVTAAALAASTIAGSGGAPVKEPGQAALAGNGVAGTGTEWLVRRPLKDLNLLSGPASTAGHRVSSSAVVPASRRALASWRATSATAAPSAPPQPALSQHAQQQQQQQAASSGASHLGSMRQVVLGMAGADCAPAAAVVGATASAPTDVPPPMLPSSPVPQVIPSSGSRRATLGGGGRLRLRHGLLGGPAQVVTQATPGASPGQGAATPSSPPSSVPSSSGGVAPGPAPGRTL